MGAKGGVGKTLLMSTLYDWLVEQKAEVLAYDGDAETVGAGLQSYVPEAAVIRITERDSLDRVINDAAEKPGSVALVDLGARSERGGLDWILRMREELGDEAAWTSVGCVTEDPLSVVSVGRWIEELGGGMDHVVVLNELANPDSDFSFFVGSGARKEYVGLRKVVSVLRLRSITPRVARAIRERRFRLAQIAAGKVDGDMAQLANRIRAREVQRHLWQQLETVKEALLPTAQGPKKA